MKISRKNNSGLFVLSVAALGIVFGDIGTSPLYAIKMIFSIGNNALTLPTSSCNYINRTFQDSFYS